MNELKINLFPEKTPQETIATSQISTLITKDTLAHSFDQNPNLRLACLNRNVSFLSGLYEAHSKHYPVRISPDNIWLLIVQAFTYHVNSDSEKLRHQFVNFEGKQKLIVFYNDISDISEVDKNILEDFSEQINELMKKYLGEELLETLTSDFSTTDYNSLIVSKISIMGTFKKYFEYSLRYGCGIPYIILEGTADDYKKILEKAKKLAKYDFNWYIERITEPIQKMIEAKEGNIDTEYFKKIIQKRYYFICVPEEEISGWITKFIAYKYLIPFEDKSINVEDFGHLACQRLDVPFIIKDEIRNIEYNMKYDVGFMGCKINENNELSKKIYL